MQLFYSNNIQGEQVFFSVEDSRHIVQSLRMRAGKHLFLTDGEGHFYEAVIISDDKRAVKASIIETRTQTPTLPWLHLYVSPTKQAARMEWMLEKVIEMGAQYIYFIETKRTIRQKIKKERLEKIAISAMKQSLQCHMPQIHIGLNFKDAVDHAVGDKFIAWCDTQDANALAQIVSPGKDTSVFIGPEGDFTDEEVNIAKAANCQPVSLGASRLRTETAGLYAASTLKVINDMNM